VLLPSADLFETAVQQTDLRDTSVCLADTTTFLTMTDVTGIVCQVGWILEITTSAKDIQAADS